jgi:hypothetical protein
MSEHDEDLGREISLNELNSILSTTICEDNRTKPIIFLCYLSTYTQEESFNVVLKADSSTGKSWDVLQCADYFPQEDVIECGYASPTAFFHEQGVLNIERREIIEDLRGKILIFLDQPGDQLIQRLRPILSHDRKEIVIKITDRSARFGLRTKNVRVIGYFSSAYCTARLRSDEQDVTRGFMLSPEISQDKLRKVIELIEMRERDPAEYYRNLETNTQRLFLKGRVLAVKNAKIRNVIVPDSIQERFQERHPILKPRHQRDFDRLYSLIKSWALLNFQKRKRIGPDIEANVTDVEVGFQLYDLIREANDLGFPPSIYDTWTLVVKPLLYGEAGEEGVDRLAIMRKHLELLGRPLPPWKLKDEILPALESANLVSLEPDPQNRRRTLVKLVTSQNTLD